MIVEDGRYTGEIDFYAYGENKAVAMREIAAAEHYDLTRSYAYSDSMTDLPMLEAVGHPHAVNPDRALRREAAARSWPVLVFTRPVRLRERLGGGLPPRQAMAAAAIGAGAATAGLVWLVSRRRQATSARSSLRATGRSAVHAVRRAALR
jgi:haloacid dehalogenase-like hydrolase